MTFFDSRRPSRRETRRVRAAFFALGVAGWAAVGCSAAKGAGSDAEAQESSAEEDEGRALISLGRGEDTDPDYASENFGDPSLGGAGGGDGGGCLSFMSFGAVALDGAVPGASGMDAIVSWLNDSSTATGEHFAEKPDITPEFLESADVILLQDLSAWEFSEEEIHYFKEWVKAGGGVLALSGYSMQPAPVLATNRLLSFSGLSYASVSEAGDTSTSLGVCAYCLGITDKQEGFNPEHPISEGITAVGAFQGRSIKGEGDVVAQEDGKILGMTVEVEEGRVFLFHDDWVSYRESWSQSAPTECAENVECAGVSPVTTYQIPRFWFNSFSWLAGEPSCFAIEGVEVVVR